MNAYLIKHFLADLMTEITEKNQDKSFTDYMSKTLRDKSKIKINKLSKNTKHKSQVLMCFLLYSLKWPPHHQGRNRNMASRENGVHF